MGLVWAPVPLVRGGVGLGFAQPQYVLGKGMSKQVDGGNLPRCEFIDGENAPGVGVSDGKFRC